MVGGSILNGVNVLILSEQYVENNDEIVNITDAYQILLDAGLITIDPSSLPKPTAIILIGILEAQYGPELINYPTLEGRIYMLYMLYLIL